MVGKPLTDCAREPAGGVSLRWDLQLVGQKVESPQNAHVTLVVMSAGAGGLSGP